MSEIENDIQADLNELANLPDFSSLIEETSPIIDEILNDEINDLLANTSVEDSLSEDSPQSRVLLATKKIKIVSFHHRKSPNLTLLSDSALST